MGLGTMNVSCEQRGAAEGCWRGTLIRELPRGQLVLVILETWAGRPSPKRCNPAEEFSPAEILGWDPQIGPSISQITFRSCHPLAKKSLSSMAPRCLQHWFSSFSVHQHHLAELVKHRSAGPLLEFLID